jgi:cysteinyl-tRNA synthetase
MELVLYDTLTRQKRVFTPLDPAHVRMYVCGPTVYDFAHIGNARPVIVFDVLFRLLRYLAKQGVWDGGKGETKVTYVRNITDVDDKIITRAAEEYPTLPLNDAILQVTRRTIRQFHADVAALSCLHPSFEPRATKYIGSMKRLIKRLVDAGHAYVAEEHVLFYVPSMPEYGRLAHRSLEDMIEGARVEVAPYKRDPMDFVLWKPSKPGEPQWPSPCGIATHGRPGWHIECSAMAWKRLGETFDIHGGGIDLVFPHHENEIAQTRCAFHAPLMANFWMHNGFLQVEGRKMAKSEGNFITIRELRRHWPGEAIRLNMFNKHYRNPIDWTLKGLEEAQRTLLHWKNIAAAVDARRIEIRPSLEIASALADDLNTVEVLHHLHEKARMAGKSSEARDELYSNLVFLGLIPDEFALAKRNAAKIKEKIQLAPDADARTIKQYLPRIEAELQKRIAWLPSLANTSSTSTITYSIITSLPGQPSFQDSWTKYHPLYLSRKHRNRVKRSIGIEKLNEQIEHRLAARKIGDFDTSDRIRDELSRIGIVLRDTQDSTTWELAP